jgi:hypothetical protein
MLTGVNCHINASLARWEEHRGVFVGALDGWWLREHVAPWPVQVIITFAIPPSACFM